MNMSGENNAASPFPKKLKRVYSCFSHFLPKLKASYEEGTKQHIPLLDFRFEKYLLQKLLHISLPILTCTVFHHNAWTYMSLVFHFVLLRAL